MRILLNAIRCLRLLRKMREYYDHWDTERYGYVCIQDDGRLIRTNNKDRDELALNKIEFGILIKFMSEGNE